MADKKNLKENKKADSGKSANVLITGGFGYLGSIITEYLISKGYRVTVLDNLYYKQKPMLHLCHSPNFDFIIGDVRNEKLMAEILPKFDYIIPLAAMVGAPVCNKSPEDAKSINYGAIRMLLKLRARHQRIIFPTTNSGYGTKSGETFCTEETPLEPISLYGQTKVDAEKILLEAGNAITLRLATVFGVSPRMRTDLLVNDFVYKAVRDGYIVIFEKHFKRNYIHIRDVARCFEHCMLNFEKMKDNAYNVGLQEANLSKEELALKIKGHMPKFFIHFSEIGQDPDKRNYIVSNDKIMGTGFKCIYDLDFGIKELIKAYKLLGDTGHSNV
ncbi:MAG: NAD-dependent epimerase/dehydratase [archaeon GW2011_AR3]|nr:MAG: NAD-dependent epimerase/dehydratase [archaeon GW2011_AR3]MBS3109600.1 SDR family oxidoreductase [Candidatus Woesearchaeota archaeon]